jgi:hypothetical protein
VHECASAGCWGSFPEVVTRRAGTLDRFIIIMLKRGVGLLPDATPPTPAALLWQRR